MTLVARKGNLRLEELSWAVGLGVLALLVIVSDDLGLRPWAFRDLGASARGPALLAAAAASLAAWRIGALVLRSETLTGWRARLLATSAALLTGAGVAALAFFSACSLLGSLGSRGPGYPMVVRVLLYALLASVGLVPLQVWRMTVALRVGARVWSAHGLALLAWTNGPIATWWLGISFLLG